ncbi:hypothetical protein G9A89_021664 [Geosiphon pyriformis]|nr:hypothetical protein G9A89_021664 [Geosiphon pyriformis]
MSIKPLDQLAVRQLRASLIINSFTQCVLELIQNSLDAFAQTIEIHVNVPQFFVQVIDNGSGIAPEDMQKIGQRHYLQFVTTYGFRGEALASISEVATVEILSKHGNYFDPYRIILKEGKIFEYGPFPKSKRRQPGTMVTIHDLFFKYPVRRKQQSSTTEANEFENVKNTVKLIALIHPEVNFTFFDISQEYKIFSTRKAASSLSIFRQLFGTSLVKKIENVFAQEDNIKISGFISKKGFNTKQHQYLYINNRYIACHEAHKVVDDLFKKSGFTRKNNLDPGPFQEPKMLDEKYPVYLIHLTCLPKDYEISADSIQFKITFQNWEKIRDLLSFLIKEFLKSHGFMKNLDQVKKSNCSSKIEHIHSLRETSPSFEDILHVKSSGKDENIFQKKIKGFGPQNTLVDNYIPFTRPKRKIGKQNIYSENQKIFKPEMNKYTRKTFYPNVRTEDWLVNPKANKVNPLSIVSFYKGIPFKEPSLSEDTHGSLGFIEKSKFTSGGRVDRSRLRTSERLLKDGDYVNDPSSTFWAEETFKKWSNPIFKNTEAPIPLSFRPDVNMKSLSFQPSRYYTLSCNMDFEKYHFKKQDLQHAEVIGQVDNKFIACQITCSLTKGHKPALKQKTQKIIVLIDQHAADERVRVESLLKELCQLSSHKQSAGQTGVMTQLARSVVDTNQIKKPYEITLTFNEIQAARRFEHHFNRWGIFYNQNEQNRNFGYDQREPSDQIQNILSSIYITHLPQIIADRCISETRVMENLLKQHLFWLEENGDDALDIEETKFKGDNYVFDKWINMTRGCPRGILDIVNSKACRGAIKFNDPLTVEQCRLLIQKLSQCNFPFQCAHGRPSMVPIMVLNNRESPTTSYNVSLRRFHYCHQKGIRDLAHFNSLRVMLLFQMLTTQCIVSEGTTKALAEEVKKAKHNRDKVDYLEYLALYNQLQFLTMKSKLKAEQTIRAGLSANTLKSIDKAISYAEAQQYLDFHPDDHPIANHDVTLFGLHNADLHKAIEKDLQEIVSSKEIIMSSIGEKLINTCEEIAKFHYFGEELNPRLLFAKATQLNKIVKQQIEDLHISKVNDTLSDQTRVGELLTEYLKVMSEILINLWSMLEEFKYRHEYEKNIIFDDYFSSIILSNSGRVLRMNALITVYDQQTSEALLSIRDNLQIEENAKCKELRELDAKLTDYQSIGGEFEEVIEAYGEIIKKIELAEDDIQRIMK